MRTGESAISISERYRFSVEFHPLSRIRRCSVGGKRVLTQSVGNNKLGENKNNPVNAHCERSDGRSYAPTCVRYFISRRRVRSRTTKIHRDRCRAGTRGRTVALVSRLCVYVPRINVHDAEPRETPSDDDTPFFSLVFFFLTILSEAYQS